MTVADGTILYPDGLSGLLASLQMPFQCGNDGYGTLECGFIPQIWKSEIIQLNKKYIKYIINSNRLNIGPGGY